MIEVGKINRLKISNFTSFGAYLDAETGIWKDNVLLPVKQQPAAAKIGDYLEVFIYRDSEDRVIATIREPLAKVGDLAYLKVTARTKIGAFLDIGLERGLLLPFSEQKFPLGIDRSYLVYVYLDKSGRLSCTTDIYEHLTIDSLYQKNDKVSGTVYLVKPEIGAFVAVDNKYLGLIPNSEYFHDLKIGDIVEARVIRVREDGKLDLTPRELSFKQMDADAETLLKAMQDNQGYLPLDEKASPEDIEHKFQMSKAAFKRAIGGLLKTDKIIKTVEGLKLV
ncbi:MAG: S1-like domain-containing RNA-binding protein [Desulfitobacteriaceae bacterium]